MASVTADTLIREAMKWVGYLEKDSNSQLDDFTANAGRKNYTRFNRDYNAYMGTKLQPAEWCGMFVSCCFAYAFGIEKAKVLLCGNLHSYTPTGASYFKKKGQYFKRGEKTPRVGDVIFFYSSAKKRIGHVGIVYKVTAARVYTIEGNTSGANNLITNGGGVCKKSYSIGSSYIDGYGRPKYDDDGSASTTSEGGKIMVGFKVLSMGAKGQEVKTLQYVLMGRGYKLPKYGADGDYGKETYSAVLGFQKAEGLEVDGVAGKETLTALYTKE